MKMFLKNVEAFDLKRRNVLLQMSRRFSNTCPQKKKFAAMLQEKQDGCRTPATLYPLKQNTLHPGDRSVRSLSQNPRT